MKRAILGSQWSVKTNRASSNLRRKLLICQCGAFFLAAAGKASAQDWSSDSWTAAILAVDVSAGSSKDVPSPGADAGSVDIRTGVNVDTGDGRHGTVDTSRELIGSAEPDVWKVCQFRQVAPSTLPGSPLVLTVSGNVEIRCQFLFAPSKIIARHTPGQPPPNLRVHAGQSLWVFENKCPPPLGQAGCETLPNMHGAWTAGGAMEVIMSPHTLPDGTQVTDAEGRALGGGSFRFWTTQRGSLVSYNIRARGSDGKYGEKGGNGGSVTLFANERDVTVTGPIDTAGGGGGHGFGIVNTVRSNGGNGGDGGPIIIGARQFTAGTLLAAPGGLGGIGASGDSNHRTGYKGGNGGNGGLINIVSAGPPHVFSIGASGGDGGIGGIGHTAPLDSGALGGTGGRGGDGGLSGFVSLPVGTTPFVLSFSGGFGGDGGPGGQGAASSTGPGSRGGQAGDGGNGGDGGGEGAQIGAGGGAGTPGPGGSGTSAGPNGAEGSEGQQGTLYPTPFMTLIQPPHPESERDTWTIMMYIAADSWKDRFLLGRRADVENGALKFLEAAERANLSGSPINVVLQLDRTMAAGSGPDTFVPTFAPAWGQWPTTKRGFLLYHPNPEIGTTLVPVSTTGTSEVATDKPASLTEFIDWAKRVAPAEKYALLLFGHGAGWRGMLHDGGSPGVRPVGSTYPVPPGLKTSGLRQAFASPGRVADRRDLWSVRVANGRSRH